MSILLDADKLINGERQKDYGEPVQSFTHISHLWSAYIGHNITPEDVAVMMALLKFVRLRNSGYAHRDSILDAAGYIGLLEKIS